MVLRAKRSCKRPRRPPRAVEVAGVLDLCIGQADAREVRVVERQRQAGHVLDEFGGRLRPRGQRTDMRFYAVDQLVGVGLFDAPGQLVDGSVPRRGARLFGKEHAGQAGHVFRAAFGGVLQRLAKPVAPADD